MNKISIEEVYDNFKNLYDELHTNKDVDNRDRLMQYLDYSTNQPMRDGEEIRDF